ncbi:MAG: acyltransferase [Methylocystis sp.]
MRGIAILSVIQLHTLLITSAYNYLQVPAIPMLFLHAGSAGVDLFFILSAYLLTTNLLRHRSTPNVISAFYLRRALRILPMFLLLILGGFTLEALWTRAGGSSETWLWRGRYPLSTYLLFLQNWRLGLDGHWSAQFFTPTWSLAVEEHFYLLLPLLVTRLQPRRFAFLAAAGILIATPIRVFLFLNYGHIAPTTWTIARLDAFGWGILIALAPTLWPNLPERINPRLLIGAGASLFAIVIVFAPFLLPGASEDNVFGATWIDFALALVTFGVVHRGAEPSRTGPVGRAFAWCGARCYSLYLLHVPALGLIFLAAGQTERPKVDNLETLGLVALSIGLTLLIADICYRRVEQPSMRLAQRIASYRGRLTEALPIEAAE